MRKTEDKKVTNFEEFETFYAVEVVREAKSRLTNGSAHGL